MRARAVLVIALWSLGCAGATGRKASLAPDEELRARAELLEHAGSVREAGELYLQCFADTQCPEVARLVAGADLRRASRVAPELEPRIWKAVEDAESRVAMAPAITPEMRGDVASVLAVYENWKRPERAQQLLGRMRRGVPTQVYDWTLEHMALILPKGLVSLSEADAEHLVSDISQRAAANDELATRARLPPSAKAELETIRVETAVGYASALVRSHHHDAAHKVIQLIIDGGRSGCDAVVDASAELADAELSAEVCRECAGVHGCATP